MSFSTVFQSDDEKEIMMDSASAGTVVDATYCISLLIKQSFFLSK